MSLAFAVVLTLTPHLSVDADLRLVSEGTGTEPVAWYLDGEHVATTMDGQPAYVSVDAGSHVLHAMSDYDDFWQALARPDPETSTVTYVPAWLAQHTPGTTAREVPTWIGPTAIAALGLVGLLVPKNP